MREACIRMSSTEVFMPRIDRLASIYLSHPLARVIGAVSATRVPILMYHSISDNLIREISSLLSDQYFAGSFREANALAAREWLPHAGPYANVDGDGIRARFVENSGNHFRRRVSRLLHRRLRCHASMRFYSHYFPGHRPHQGFSRFESKVWITSHGRKCRNCMPRAYGSDHIQ